MITAKREPYCAYSVDTTSGPLQGKKKNHSTAGEQEGEPPPSTSSQKTSHPFHWAAAEKKKRRRELEKNCPMQKGRTRSAPGRLGKEKKKRGGKREGEGTKGGSVRIAFLPFESKKKEAGVPFSTTGIKLPEQTCTPSCGDR